MKKILAIVLVILMFFSLSACKDEAVESSSSSKPSALSNLKDKYMPSSSK